jgi:hypothetical protein
LKGVGTRGETTNAKSSGAAAVGCAPERVEAGRLPEQQRGCRTRYRCVQLVPLLCPRVPCPCRRSLRGRASQLQSTEYQRPYRGLCLYITIVDATHGCCYVQVAAALLMRACLPEGHAVAQTVGWHKSRGGYCIHKWNSLLLKCHQQLATCADSCLGSCRTWQGHFRGQIGVCD